MVQDLGGAAALQGDRLLGELTRAAGEAGLRVSPMLLLGGGLALAADTLRSRARRERSRGRRLAGRTHQGPGADSCARGAGLLPG